MASRPITEQIGHRFLSVRGQPYASPMFLSINIPYGFVQYGKNHTVMGSNNSDKYVYSTAIAQNTTVSSNPSQLKLARVSIANIGNQNAADWSYYKGGDGMLDANGSSSVSAGLR